jgi:hypothetical protein
MEMVNNSHNAPKRQKRGQAAHSVHSVHTGLLCRIKSLSEYSNRARLEKLSSLNPKLDDKAWVLLEATTSWIEGLGVDGADLGKAWGKSLASRIKFKDIEKDSTSQTIQKGTKATKTTKTTKAQKAVRVLCLENGTLSLDLNPSQVPTLVPHSLDLLTPPKVDDLCLKNSWWSPEDSIRLEFLVDYYACQHFKASGSTVTKLQGLLELLTHGSVACDSLQVLKTVKNLVIKGNFICLRLLSNGKYIRSPVEREPDLWLAPVSLFSKEMGIEIALVALLSQPEFEDDVPPEGKACLEMLKGDLDQFQGVTLALDRPVSVVTGPGGSGKTSFVSRAIWDAKIARGWKVLGIVPTHAAKKVLQSDLNANPDNVVTLASLIYKYPGSRSRIEKMVCSLAEDSSKIFIVMDEMSMVCLTDFSDLLSSLKSMVSQGVKVGLLMIGDANQLPPIEQGSPFIDIMKSGLLPVTQLKKVYRASSAGLSEFCTGTLSRFWTLNPSSSNCLQNAASPHVSCSFLENDIEIFKKVETVLRGLYLLNGDVPMVITKLNDHCRTIAGIIRSVVHEGKSNMRESKAMGFELTNQSGFAIGDKVLFNTNTQYWKNGDEGVVIDIRKNPYPKYTLRFTMNFNHNAKDDDEIELISKLDSDQGSVATLGQRHISPSTCRTVHKCQGSGFEHVIFVKSGHCSSFHACQRENYTAYSRAKTSLHIIGNYSSLNGRFARESEKRDTLLSPMLQRKIEQ